TVAVPSLPDNPQVVHEGRRRRTKRIADLSHYAIYRVWRDVLRGGDRAVACNGPAVRAGGRRNRAGRTVRACACIYRTGRDGHRDGVRHDGRTARDVRGLSRRARATYGAVHGVAHL